MSTILNVCLTKIAFVKLLRKFKERHISAPILLKDAEAHSEPVPSIHVGGVRRQSLDCKDMEGSVSQVLTVMHSEDSSQESRQLRAKALMTLTPFFFPFGF